MGSIALENVTKSFGEHTVIPPINLDIEDGQFVVFVGPSGCGKSTLLRLIAGLEDTSSGVIKLDGVDMTDSIPAKRQLSMVFQSYALYPHMSVYNNIAFPLKMANIDKATIDAKVKDAARVLNLTDYLERKPRQLSGGQRQRVAIGRAIVREPRIFLFDEPLSNLDAELRVQMRVEIAKLHHDLGNTMIYVTHDQVEAMTMANKIVVLSAGNIEQVGKPLDLYNNPRNKFVAGFLGSPKMNFLEGTVDAVDGSSASLNVGGAIVALRQALPGFGKDDKLTFGVRPEHMGISEGSGTKFADVRVDLVEQLGDTTMVYASTRGGQPLTIALEGQRPLEIGSTVTSYIDPTRYHVFGPDGLAI